RNDSSKVQELLLCRWETLEAGARDENGKPLKVVSPEDEDDHALFRVRLPPNEQVEIPGPPVVFGGPPVKGLLAYVQSPPGKVRLHFDLEGLPAPLTGEVVVEVK